MDISVNMTIQNVTLVTSLPVFFQEESVSHIKQETMKRTKQTRKIKAQELDSWRLFPNFNLLSQVSVEVM